MTVDYPDFTRMMQIVGSDIDVPISIDAVTVTLGINVVAADIMMPIDMQAAYIMMPIDIQGQVDDMNININIKAQEITNLTIDINAQHVGMYLQPDWNVKEDNDKNYLGTASCVNGTNTVVLDQEVTAATAFYITQWGFNVWTNTGVWARLLRRHIAEDTYLCLSGGFVGGAHSLTKPIAVVAGDYIRIELTQWSGGDVAGYGNVGGYEI